MLDESAETKLPTRSWQLSDFVRSRCCSLTRYQNSFSVSLKASRRPITRETIYEIRFFEKMKETKSKRIKYNPINVVTVLPQTMRLSSSNRPRIFHRFLLRKCSFTFLLSTRVTLIVRVEGTGLVLVEKLGDGQWLYYSSTHWTLKH